MKKVLLFNFLANKIITMLYESKLNKKQIKAHAIAWTMVFLYMTAMFNFDTTWDIATIINRILCLLNFMFVFYSLSAFVFPKFWKKNYLLLGISIFSILILFWINGRIIWVKIYPALGGEYYEEKLTGYLGRTFYFFLITASAGTASFFIRYGLNKLKLQSEKEKALLLKEITFVKNRFNSRLTFDFLNHCQKNVSGSHPETAVSIRLFSKMLEYTLGTTAEKKVNLEDEIDFLQNFISIQKLLSTKFFADFTYEGNPKQKQIYPRILITFVENAFKHGIINDSENPIDIKLNVTDNILYFTVKNKINKHKKIQSSYTGIENVKQTLDLFYPGLYNLNIQEEEVFYIVELEIRLN